MAPMALVQPWHLEYVDGMGDAGWLVVVVMSGGLLVPLARRWYRRRVAAKAADRLLAEVLKGKDAFRR